jgi:hypothetical protein
MHIIMFRLLCRFAAAAARQPPHSLIGDGERGKAAVNCCSFQ